MGGPPGVSKLKTIRKRAMLTAAHPVASGTTTEQSTLPTSIEDDRIRRIRIVSRIFL